MKFRLIKIGLALVGFAFLLYWCSPYTHTIYALGNRNLELVFLVTDSETGEPISNASIDMQEEEHFDKKEQQRIIKLVTDANGRTKFVHENNSCEDVIRPFRRTVTSIDLTWAVADVSATGYNPVEKLWLHTAKYENKGYLTKDRIQRIEFSVPLGKRTGN